jgi:hypothetical protein
MTNVNSSGAGDDFSFAGWDGGKEFLAIRFVDYSAV